MYRGDIVVRERDLKSQMKACTGLTTQQRWSRQPIIEGHAVNRPTEIINHSLSSSRETGCVWSAQHANDAEGPMCFAK
jgi:hypothetical protein